MKYFKLTTETKVNAFGITLFRLEFIIDCVWGKIGEKGGWIESETTKYGDARVSGNALVLGNAQVYGDARVYGDAWDKSPLQIQGTRHFFTTSSKTEITIGCKTFKFDFWKKHFKNIGKEENYTDMEIKEYGMYIDLAILLFS